MASLPLICLGLLVRFAVICGDDRIDLPNQVTTFELASINIPCQLSDPSLQNDSQSYVWTKVGEPQFQQLQSSLIIEPVLTTDAGVYVCQATLTGQWTAESSMDLVVEYMPRWPNYVTQKFAAPEGETAALRCEVRAFPAVDFTWTYQGYRLTANTVTDYTSVFTLYTVHDTDYGTYVCSATNTQGSNSFSLTLQPPGIPDPPFTCSILNITNYDAHLSCLPGFDGGAPLSFAVEKTGTAITPRFLRTTSTWEDDGMVTVRGEGLYPNLTYVLRVYGENEYGLSTSSYSVQIVTEAGPFVPILSVDLGDSDNSLAYILGGVAGGLVLIIIVVLISIKCARRKKDSPSTTPMPVRTDELEENKFNREIERQSVRDRREYFGTPRVPPSVPDESQFVRSTNRHSSRNKLRSSFGIDRIRQSFGRQPRRPPEVYGADFGGTSYEEFEKNCHNNRAYAIQLQGFDDGETNDFAYQNDAYQGSRDCLESAFMNPMRPEAQRKHPSYQGYIMGNTQAYNNARAMTSQQPSLAGMGALSSFPILDPLDGQPRGHGHAGGQVYPNYNPGQSHATVNPVRPTRPVLNPVSPPDVSGRPLMQFPSASSLAGKPTVAVPPFMSNADSASDADTYNSSDPLTDRDALAQRTAHLPKQPKSQLFHGSVDNLNKRPPSHLRVSSEDLLRLDNMFGSTDNLNRSDPYGGKDPFEGVDSFVTPNKERSMTLQSNASRGSTYSLPDDFWEFSHDKLYIRQKIGDGVMGEAWRARAEGICGRPGQTVVAVKMLKDDYNAEERRALLRELKVMKSLQPHPNIIALLGCCTKREPTYIIMEYAARGTLQTLLRSYRLPWTSTPADKYSPYANLPPMRKLTYRDLLVFGLQVASGMDYLASRDLLHRDLSARNVLVDEEYVCKVADFGFARDVAQSRQYESRTQNRLPIRWMSPEALFDCIYSTKSDVWAYGIVLWEIVTLGSSPYPGVSGADVMEMVQGGYRMQKPALCEDNLYVLMRECWMNDPRQRPMFTEIRHRLEVQLNNYQDDVIFVDQMKENFYEILENVPGEKC